MTYTEYKEKAQQEFNALPIFYAFSNKQLEEAMRARGLTLNDTDKIYKLGDTGGFYLRSDSPVIKAYFNREDDPLAELMKDHDFAVNAFRYEMDNHEYAINYYQGDWEVCGCFAPHGLKYGEDKTYVEYLTEAGMADLIPAYQEARRSHMKAAEEWL